MLYFVLEQITFKEEEKETSPLPRGKGLINYSMIDKDKTHIGYKGLGKKHIIVLVIIIIVIIKDECMLILQKTCLDAELQSLPYY